MFPDTRSINPISYILSNGSHRNIRLKSHTARILNVSTMHLATAPLVLTTHLSQKLRADMHTILAITQPWMKWSCASYDIAKLTFSKCPWSHRVQLQWTVFKIGRRIIKNVDPKAPSIPTHSSGWVSFFLSKCSSNTFCDACTNMAPAKRPIPMAESAPAFYMLEVPTRVTPRKTSITPATC